jgi:hypothetical protein
MSCTPVSPAMRGHSKISPHGRTSTLRTCAASGRGRGGGVMESGELTGAGLAHVGELPTRTTPGLSVVSDAGKPEGAHVADGS